MLSVSVVLSVSVESVMECQMRANDVFLRAARCEVPRSLFKKKPPLAAMQAFSLRTQELSTGQKVSPSSAGLAGAEC